MIKNIRHTGIVVDNLGESLEFYVGKLGFNVHIRSDESGSFISQILGLKDVEVTTVKLKHVDGQMIELLDYTSHKKKNLQREINQIGPTHIAFTVDNVEAIYADFKNTGIKQPIVINIASNTGENFSTISL